MAVAGDHAHRSGSHPIHVIFLAGTIPLFLGALLSDIAYWMSYEIQWSNFASWLVAGGVVFAVVALLCSFIGLFRPDYRNRSAFISFVLLLATCILAFLNALFHARDAWGMMPAALILSVLVFLLTLSASGYAFHAHRQGGDR